MTNLVKDEHIQIDKLELGPFGTNAYILVCRQTSESVVVDAPADAGQIMELLEGTHPKYILITHNHMDHTGALADLKAALDLPVAAHGDDAGSLPVPTDQLLNDGDLIACGNIKLSVMHTPGHTPGSICFLTGRYLIAGDTLFPDGPGRTGSPADFKKILESLTGKVFVLPDDTRVFSGHGSDTTLGKERRAFEDFSDGSHSPSLCGDVLWSSA
ncbi:Hydroxyacylglutathione hydrolase (EC [Olavius algarvensis Delta 1 endosymbiont]|nr:Hydroxyacylglutathione hydrolase (EC [Olavius algarvensis Delta 1 endosymbiont]